MSSTTTEPTPCERIHSSACPRLSGSACEPVISGRDLPLKYAATGESVTSIPGAQLEARPAAARPASCAANAEKTGTNATASIAADATEASLTAPAYLSRAAAGRSAIAEIAGYKDRWLPL